MPDPGGGPGRAAPRCAVHGEMRPREADINGYTGTVWVCLGWDGEGCDSRALCDWEHQTAAGQALLDLIRLGGQPQIRLTGR